MNWNIKDVYSNGTVHTGYRELQFARLNALIEKHVSITSVHVLLLLLLLLQPFNGFFSRTTWVSRYQKGKTNLDFTGARDSEWQWHQLGHMPVCTSLQTDNHANTPPLVFTGRMPFLLPNQQRQSTEGTTSVHVLQFNSVK